MNQIKINQKLKNIEFYLGTYSLDDLIDLNIKFSNSFLILNLNSLSNSNWIAIAIYPDSIFICDCNGSLDSDKLSKNVINFLHIISFNKTLHVTKKLINLKSQFSGELCTLFTQIMSDTDSFSFFLSNFSNNLDINECMLCLLYNSYFEKNKQMLLC